MPFGAALSEHPVPAHAVGEVVGKVLEDVGEEPDLAILFVAAAHTGALDDINHTVRTILRPRTLLGCTTSTVVGPSREVEDQPAISLWAGRFGTCHPVRMEALRTTDGMALTGYPSEELQEGEQAPLLLLLADPFSFPVDALLDVLPSEAGDVSVVGGLASAARGPGGNRLVLDDAVFSDGAVGAVLTDVAAEPLVSQGCRPIGEPMIVTRGEGTAIAELAGKPALERLEEVLRALPPDELEMAQRGLHIGRVVDEHKLEHGRGDFLIRNVIGADRAASTLAIGDHVDVGTTVQFQVRDAGAADEELRHLLSSRDADSALLFTCNGRGSNLFGVPDHDAAAVADALGMIPLSGMSCAGEIGPVGGRSFLHGFTASMLLFHDR